MSSAAGFLATRSRAVGVRDCDTGPSTSTDAASELPDLLSTSAPAKSLALGGNATSPAAARSALRFVALLAFSPWLAYFLLSLIAPPESAWSFVSSCLWFATPVLVISAGLFALDRGRQSANPWGDSK